VKLKKILKNITYCTKSNIENINIVQLTHNSREIQKGSLFIALRGHKTDGNSFINEAIDKGAVAILSDIENTSHNVPYIKVNDARECLSKISSNFYSYDSSKMNLIGVTGTNGKTSICHIISNILTNIKINNFTMGTLGLISSQGVLKTNFTTPESNQIHKFLNIMGKNDITTGVMEVSSHSLDLNRVDDIKFDVGVFSNLSPEHLDFHKNMNSYFQSKLKLFKKLNSNKNAIINIDDKYSNEIIKHTKSKIIKYSLNQNTDISVKNYSCNSSGTTAKINIYKNEYRIKTNLIGRYNLMNLLASIGACLAMGFNEDDIIKSISLIKSIPGRLEMIKLKQNKKVYFDYAHTPDAYENVLSTLKSISSKKIITLFGCGGNRDKSKRSKMASIAEHFSDFTIITSDNPRNEDLLKINNDIIFGFKNKNFKIINDRKSAIKMAVSMMTDNHILVILGKGREKYQVIKNKKYYHSDIEEVLKYS